MTTSGRSSLSTNLLRSLVLGLGACLAFATPAARAADNPKVELETSEGKIVIEVDPQKAPISSENFLKYVDDGFYNGLIFHRVIPDFMIQGGGFTDKLHEKNESEGVRAPIKNESGNGLMNKRGSIAMARTNNPNSATCQFYINHVDNDFLDRSGYAVFGKVVEGMDVVDAIAKSPTTFRASMKDVPVKPVIIKTAKRVKA